ncbi:hypothetical protein V6N12_062279 [Hibiscus sabdariffa]|uniref:Uncharacterized protein n=1 Tax=Hibiscus sabdariffa TaxID=183260 RepID=A0ABR2F8D3_9ROSI
MNLFAEYINDCQFFRTQTEQELREKFHADYFVLDMDEKLHAFLMRDNDMSNTMLNNNFARILLLCWYWRSYSIRSNIQFLSVLLMSSLKFLALVKTCKEHIIYALETLKPTTLWERTPRTGQELDGVLIGSQGFGVAIKTLCNCLESEYGNAFALNEARRPLISTGHLLPLPLLGHTRIGHVIASGLLLGARLLGLELV